MLSYLCPQATRTAHSTMTWSWTTDHPPGRRCCQTWPTLTDYCSQVSRKLYLGWWKLVPIGSILKWHRIFLISINLESVIVCDMAIWPLTHVMEGINIPTLLPTPLEGKGVIWMSLILTFVHSRFGRGPRERGSPEDSRTCRQSNVVLHEGLRSELGR